MALTVTVTKRNVVGAAREAVGTVVFDSSYLTGGESFTTADVDSNQAAGIAFDHVSVEPLYVGGATTLAATRIGVYDYANKTLALWDLATHAQVSSTNNEANTTMRFLVRYQQASG